MATENLIDVMMPDGTLIRGVPEGVTQADLSQRLRTFQDQTSFSDLEQQLRQGAQQASQALMTHGRETMNWMAGGSPSGVDYVAGVEDYPLRREMAIRDKPAEVDAYLNQAVGKDNWYRDDQGRAILRPEGLKARGLDPAAFGNRDVAIDEAGISMADLEEFAAESAAPTIGGVIGGALGTPFGPLGIAGGAGIGAMAGRAGQEAWEALTGRNLQSPYEAGIDLTAEGLYGALPAEAGTAALGSVGRKVTAPYAGRVAPEDLDLMRESMATGVVPTFSQVVPEAGLVARSAGIAKRLFPWSKREKENVQNLQREVASLLNDLPVEQAKAEAGETVRRALEAGRQGFAAWGRELYQPLKDRVGGTDVPVVPTQGIKDVAGEILGALPPTVRGGQEVPMELGQAEYRNLQEFMNFPENLTLDQTWALRERLRDIRANPQMNPGISDRALSRLYNSTSEALGAIPEHGSLAKALSRIYEKQIKAGQDALFDRILRNPGEVGSIPAEQVVGRLFEPRSGERLTRFMRRVPEEFKPAIQRAAFGKITDEVTKGSGDIQDFLVSGGDLLKTLRKYDSDTLRAMFGRERTNQLYKLGRVMELNSRTYKDYGQLVAAAIATRPIANLGRLAQFRALKNFYESPTGLKLLTEGLDFRSGKGQATRALAEALTRMMTYGAAGAGEGVEESEGPSQALDWLGTGLSSAM